MQLGQRFNEKFLQLSCSLVVAPVANPVHLGRLSVRKREKMCRVRRFVKGPCAARRKSLKVDSADGLAKGQYSIELRNGESCDLLWLAVRTMMRVVEEHLEPEALPQTQDILRKFWRVPLVQYHHIRIFQFGFEEGRGLRRICAHVQIGK